MDVPELWTLGVIEHMEYSSMVEFLLFVFWAVGSLLLAWFVWRRHLVYIGSVVLSAPMIGYSMVGYGELPMGGVIHAICAGLFALPFHYFFQRFRVRRMDPR